MTGLCTVLWRNVENSRLRERMIPWQTTRFSAGASSLLPEAMKACMFPPLDFTALWKNITLPSKQKRYNFPTRVRLLNLWRTLCVCFYCYPFSAVPFHLWVNTVHSIAIFRWLILCFVWTKTKLWPCLLDDDYDVHRCWKPDILTHKRSIQALLKLASDYDSYIWGLVTDLTNWQSPDFIKV